MKQSKIRRILICCAITFLLLTLATVIGGLFALKGIHPTNIVVLYIFSVLLIARFTDGHVYGMVGTVLSTLLFNWFFTEPYFTLKVDDPTYIITFAIMSITAIMTSALTTKVKQSAQEAKEKEAESNALYQLTNHLTDAEDVHAIASITVKIVSKILSSNAACICFDENGDPESTFIQQKSDGTQVRRELESRAELKKRMEGLHTSYDPGREFWDFPIYGSNGILAVLRLPTDTAEEISEAQTRLLHSIIESAALALERFRSLQNQAKIREQATQERYRGNLLRAISHDLRTPLSGIMGTSEMLMGMTDREDPRYDMAEGIYKDADWLHALVENILNLTKLQDGRLTLYKEPEVVEEVLGAALTVLEKRFPGREISVTTPDTLLMVPMDARLISQVLVNLLDNAVKHTPEGEPIGISVSADQAQELVYFEIFDHGCGISEEDLPHIFQTFYTTRGKSADAQRGVGLGLSICQSIVEAHGGQIWAENREGGGAKFTFTLPFGDEDSDNA